MSFHLEAKFIWYFHHKIYSFWCQFLLSFFPHMIPLLCRWHVHVYRVYCCIYFIFAMYVQRTHTQNLFPQRYRFTGNNIKSFVVLRMLLFDSNISVEGKVCGTLTNRLGWVRLGWIGLVIVGVSGYWMKYFIWDDNFIGSKYNIISFHI